MIKLTTCYLEPFFVGLFEAQGRLYFRKLATTQSPYLRVILPPTKENEARVIKHTPKAPRVYLYN